MIRARRAVANRPASSTGNGRSKYGRRVASTGSARPRLFCQRPAASYAAHRAACRWATEAFARVGKPGAVLAYATHTPDWVERFEPALESVGAYMDDTRTPVTPVDELAYAVQLEGDLLETKLRAIRSMTSQIEPLVAALGESFFREGMVEEAFRLP